MAGQLDVDLLDVRPFTDGTADAGFADLRARAAVHFCPEPDGPGFWSVVRHAEVKAVLSDHAAFVNGRGTQIPDRKAEGEGLASLHNSDPPRHSALRRILAPHLRPAQVRPMGERVSQVVDDLLDRIVPGERFDLVPAVSLTLPILVFGAMLGVPPQDCPLLVDWTNRTSSLDPEYAAGPQEAVAAREELFAYFHDLQDARRAAPRDDLVSVLTAAELDGRPLRREELDPYCLLLTVAGNETTRNLVSGGLHLLSGDDATWQALQADPALVDPVIEELIRLVSPVMHMRRTASAPVELGGAQIAAGDKVVTWFVSANRDERVFSDPDRITLGRTPNEHVGFGWGIHSCMGAHLARLELQVLLRRLLSRELRVRSLEEPDMLASNWFRGYKHLPAVLEPSVA